LQNIYDFIVNCSFSHRFDRCHFIGFVGLKSKHFFYLLFFKRFQMDDMKDKLCFLTILNLNKKGGQHSMWTRMWFFNYSRINISISLFVCWNDGYAMNHLVVSIQLLLWFKVVTHVGTTWNVCTLIASLNFILIFPQNKNQN
jgi:hypothetical protein